MGLRVLWLIKGLGPGGAEQLLLSTARRMDRSRVEPEVAYLLPWKDALVEPLRAAGVEVHCLDVHREVDLRWAGRLRSLLLERKVDVVHAHSPYAAGIARLVARTLPIAHRPPVISTEHNQWSSYARATRVLTTATYPLGAAWLSVSEQSRASLPDRLRRRVEVLVHGVEVDRIVAARLERAEARAELELRAEDVAVVTVANLRPQKAYPDLLYAARRVVDQRPNVRFLAVGQGPQQQEMDDLRTALGLDDHAFRFLGFRTDAVRILAAADVFVLASRYEGYPVALMEALAMGLPVVATAVSGVVDAVSDGVEGILVRPGDPDALAAAIVRMNDEPARRAAMATRAADRGAHFDIADAVRRTETLYEDVVERARAPRP